MAGRIFDRAAVADRGQGRKDTGDGYTANSESATGQALTQFVIERMKSDGDSLDAIHINMKNKVKLVIENKKQYKPMY